jgi:ADP-ribose pyrophosphatase YjhB (NUDIX family)
MRYEYSGQCIYNLPGGNLEFGEEMKEALSRELDEELGVEVVLSEAPVLIAEVINERGETLHVMYEATLVKGIPQLNPSETTALELVWLPIDSLAEVNMYPAVGKHIQLWKEGQLESPHVGQIEQIWI